MGPPLHMPYRAFTCMKGSFFMTKPALLAEDKCPSQTAANEGASALLCEVRFESNSSDGTFHVKHVRFLGREGLYDHLS